MKLSLSLMICHNFGSRVDLIQNCGGDTFCFPWGRGDLLAGFGGCKGGPCMTHPRPGIDISVATEEAILHAAAFLEFKRHVERLIRAGNPLLHTFVGRTLWRCCIPRLWARPHQILLSCRLRPSMCMLRSAPGWVQVPLAWAVIPAHVAPTDAWDFYYGHHEKMDLLLLAAVPVRATWSGTPRPILPAAGLCGWWSRAVGAGVGLCVPGWPQTRWPGLRELSSTR